MTKNACVRDGFFTAIEFAEASKATKKVVIYAGGGAGVCGGVDEAAYLNETLKAVAARDAGRFPIYAVGTLVYSSIRDHFLSDLAGQNGGSYTRIER